MLNNVRVVIGANFGDEGKGLVTDYYASLGTDSVLVVRFNGGAQAGHTVETPAGARHVFSHVGSGAFCKADTYLSQYFVVSPIHFSMEMEQLLGFNLHPNIFVDPAAPVTTLYDMVINRAIEEQRGGQRHGSCGVGFGETLERQLTEEFSLTVNDLKDSNQLRETLHHIRVQWLPQRLQQLSIINMSDVLKEWIDSDELFERFLEEAAFFIKQVTLTRLNMIENYRSVVFEGAQGLLLDQDTGEFPHVTRSNTGLTNVIQLLNSYSINTLKVTYVTRSYLTRHGAGTLPHELSQPPFKKIIDKTNFFNPYQGALRFSWLSLDLLKAAITRDLMEVPATMSIEPSLAITCLDQVDDIFTYVENNRVHKTTVDQFLKHSMNCLNIPHQLKSYGATRNAICDE